MRVVIAGAGRVGLNIAVYLQRANHEVIVVDTDEAVAKKAFELHGLVSLIGDATDASMLREAGTQNAHVVVGLLPRDADNLAVCLLSRTAGAKRVMVRMRDPEYRMVYEAAGVHQILSETDVYVGALATAIEHEAVRHSMILGTGESVAFEIAIPKNAFVVGKQVSEVASWPTFPNSCVIAGMCEPDGCVQAPRGSSIIRAGMTVLLVASRQEIGGLIELFMRETP